MSHSQVLTPWRSAGARLRAWRAAERTAFVAGAGAAALLRVLAVTRYRIDSDEPQHLHVVWGWTRGLMQYRDVFDNHMPLFHLAMAPLLRLFGERAATLIWMRAAMLPLYAATIVLTYRIAMSCYPRRTAMWSTLVASLLPGYLLCSTEFRTDDLWTLFWLWSMAILVAPSPALPDETLARGVGEGGGATRLRASPRTAVAGLVLGLAAATSAKTTLLLAALLVGAATALVVARGSIRAAARQTIVFLAAFALPPAAIAAWFAARGALRPFVYATITHNVGAGVHLDRVAAFPCLLVLIAIAAKYVHRSGTERADGVRRLFLFVTANVYAAAMFCLWPIVEREHWLPYYPLAAITIVPFVARSSVRRYAAIAVAEIALVIGLGGLWHDRTGWGIRVIDQTLRLTAADEAVVDLKGETVFRRRAFFYILEPMTRVRIRSGAIKDTIIRDILRAHVMLAPRNIRGFPRAARRFLDRNFVAVGAVRVVGKYLRRRDPAVRVQVPATYAVVGEHGPFTGSIDGRVYEGPRFLAAGVHTIAAARADDFYALLWARAAERGFSPFPKRTHPQQRARAYVLPYH